MMRRGLLVLKRESLAPLIVYVHYTAFAVNCKGFSSKNLRDAVLEVDLRSRLSGNFDSMLQ